MLNNRLGAYILEQRRRLDLTQQQLADRVGVHQTRVSHWERGSRMPTGDQLQALGEVFGVGWQDLLTQHLFDNEVERALLRDDLLEQADRQALLTLYRSLASQKIGAHEASTGSEGVR